MIFVILILIAAIELYAIWLHMVKGKSKLSLQIQIILTCTMPILWYLVLTKAFK